MRLCSKELGGGSEKNVPPAWKGEKYINKQVEVVRGGLHVRQNKKNGLIRKR